jgi:membrane fusion protein (multidrug efflux system)
MLPFPLKLLYSYAAVVLFTLALAGCGGDESLETLIEQREEIDAKIKALEEASASGRQEASIIPITTSTAIERPFEHVIDVRGSVQSRTTITVSPRTGGIITKLPVSNGMFVQKGALLLEIDSELTRRSIEEIETQLELATTLFERQRRIYEAKAGSEIQYLQAKSTKESLEKRLASVREQLALHQVAAPVSGIVDGLRPRVGENVAPGIPVMTIVNTADMHVVVDLAEAHVRDVTIGDPVTIIVPDAADSIQTRISMVGKVIDPVSRTVRVEIPLSRVSPSVRPNMTAIVRINDLTIPKAIAVPLSGIVRDGEKAYVHVVKNDVASRRDVTVGRVSGSLVHVLSGLTADDRVVVGGALEVADGQRVRIVNDGR